MNQSLIIGTGGHVVAIDRRTGFEIWRTKIPLGAFGGSTRMSVKVADECVYAGASGQVFCLDVNTGEELWHNGLEGLGHNEVEFAS